MTSKRKTEAQRWFQQAFYDLKATRWNIQGGFYDTAWCVGGQIFRLDNYRGTEKQNIKSPFTAPIKGNLNREQGDKSRLVILTCIFWIYFSLSQALGTTSYSFSMR